MEKSDQGGKGTVVLATVKGDVHDIGKNLVDIILTNNGYEVVNLGIKIGINEMVSAVEEHKADAIGMSGLLVKSTLIMRENLVELNDRSLSDIPVLLGGAALTRTYVERDLREVYDGRLFYGRDAFEGLRTMDRLVELKRRARTTRCSAARSPRRTCPGAAGSTTRTPRRSRASPPAPTWRRTTRCSRPPFVGSRVAVGIPIDDVAEYLNLTALFRNQWGFRPENGENDTEFKDRVKATLREQLGKAKEADLLVPSVAYGHFAANAEGNDLVIWKDESRGSEWMRFTFPRQRKEPWLCIADFFRPTSRATRTSPASCSAPSAPGRRRRRPGCSPRTSYQEYLFLHGLSVEMAEATAEYWHQPDPRGARVRRRGRPDPDRPVPPAVPGRALLVGLPGLPRPDRQRQGRGAAGRGPHRRHGQRGVPAQPRADDRRHHLPPPRGQVLRRVTLTWAARAGPVAVRSPSLAGGPRRGGAGRRRRRPARRRAGAAARAPW